MLQIEDLLTKIGADADENGVDTDEHLPTF